MMAKRKIKNECMGSGGSVMTSLEERCRGEARCSTCGRIFRLRRGQAGLVVDRVEHMLPRHAKPVIREWSSSKAKTGRWATTIA
jgi:hypothetical protein